MPLKLNLPVILKAKNSMVNYLLMTWNWHWRYYHIHWIFQFNLWAKTNGYSIFLKKNLFSGLFLLIFVGLKGQISQDSTTCYSCTFPQIIQLINLVKEKNDKQSDSINQIKVTLAERLGWGALGGGLVTFIMKLLESSGGS